MPDPISNPGVTPTPSTPGVSRERPLEESGEGMTHFSLPQKQPEPQAAKGAPTPMQLAGEGRGSQGLMEPEALKDQMKELSTRLQRGREKVENFTNPTPDHQTALGRLVEKLNPDMRSIASKMGLDYQPVTRQSGQSVIDFVTDWIDGSQKTMTDALAKYAADPQKLDPAKQMALQVTMQRASERAELFASIVGSGVSGVKTIMSMQLG